MGNYSIFYVHKTEITRFKYDIPFHALIPFSSSDYKRGIFKTTVKKAKERFLEKGITLKKIEKKIAEIIGIEYNDLKNFRISGKDVISEDEDEEFSIEIKLEYFEEETDPELFDVYEILKSLDLNKDSAVVSLNVREIKNASEMWPTDISELFNDAQREYIQSLAKINMLEDFKEYDCFICHDSGDKLKFVEPLAENLKKIGIHPWYDKFVLKVGDSIIDKIDEGLKSSKFGIVVLSKNFIKNTNWPKTEFNSLKIKEIHSGKKLILPIWRKGITEQNVASYNLELANRFALKEKDGIKSIVKQLETKIRS